ncbi:cytochrome b5-like heme/steroid binding domain-containing protein [Lachancea thermotolerans CBS 6340]|uniref:KLTH0D16566p n=1 Tax=Lachancea thermotolerans (strain ATCC 56472 / CBS 6340 / NRRL Y-8284) TaxID=559295 RepID=C5DFN5_LACTC|nr:KLTH0D16566p [Lachancea thermotolerans CBS 6340]CAR22990.1 KLTH0D16566p [Lachancea thermotolerans CBS 6340]
MLRRRSTRHRSPAAGPGRGRSTSDGATARSRFTWLDIARMLCGLALAVLAVGRLATGSATWHVVATWRARASAPSAPPALSEFWRPYSLPLTFSPADLSRYTGADGAPLLVAVDGQVFDVTRSARLYGPRGAYHRFVGRDCSRAFAYSIWSMRGLREPCSADLSGLATEERARVVAWAEYFARKYPRVGHVAHVTQT